jgi:hypothetical protein
VKSKKFDESVRRREDGNEQSHSERRTAKKKGKEEE